MDDYKLKYFKYKNKYIQLKKLVGGIDLNEKWSLIDIDNDTSITTELDKKYKYNLLQMNFTNQRPKQVKHFEKILNNLIEKPESKILLYRQKIYANDGSTEICDTYVTCLDYNIILEKKEEYKQIPALKQLPTNQLDFDTNTNIITDTDHKSYYDYFQNLITNSKYNEYNLYVAIAPITMAEFYLPSFLRDFLDKNPEEKLLILITALKYNESSTSLNTINVNDIYQYLSELKMKYGERIKFIHWYSTFYTSLRENNPNYENFKFTTNAINFYNNIKKSKLNIMYIGLLTCGKIEHLKDKLKDTKLFPNGYLYIGCDAYIYNDKILKNNETCRNTMVPTKSQTLAAAPGLDRSSIEKCNISFETVNVNLLQ